MLVLFMEGAISCRVVMCPGSLRHLLQRATGCCTLKGDMIPVSLFLIRTVLKEERSI